MSAIDSLRTLLNAKRIKDDHGSVELSVEPPRTAEQINELQTQISQPFPQELRALLECCSEITGCGIEIDLTGETMSLGMEEVFPCCHPIAADGFGNFWVLDLTPATTETAPVFFACHDAPVVLYQSDSLTSFLTEALRSDNTSIDDVHEDRLFEVWRTNPGVISQSEACQATDPVLRSFAAELAESYQIVDLRDVQPGMGFSWGRYGPRTMLRRHGFERIFAYAKPPVTPGFFARLLGWQ